MTSRTTHTSQYRKSIKPSLATQSNHSMQSSLPMHTSHTIQPSQSSRPKHSGQSSRSSESTHPILSRKASRPIQLGSLDCIEWLALRDSVDLLEDRVWAMPP